jgi:hypothetical protein
MAAKGEGETMRRFLMRLFLLAVGINFLWEMAQMPLYENMPFDDPMSWWLCFRASLGDGIIVLAIWAIGIALFRSRGWFAPLGGWNTLVLLLTGAVIATVIEIHALATGRWAYSGLMPTIPFVGVGVSPFIQLLLLPWLSMICADRLGPTGGRRLRRG